MLVIDRKPGYSDEMMYSYCQILASVVNKTIDVNSEIYQFNMSGSTSAVKFILNQ